MEHPEAGVYLGDYCLGCWAGDRLYYCAARPQPFGPAPFDQIAFVPFLFPTIAFGAMYLTLFAEPVGPIPALYGTFTLLVLISVVSRLPYSVKTGVMAITQIGQELEEAAELAGASWAMRFRRVIMPLASSGVLSGMMVSFVGVMRELSLIILLITPSTRVLMTVGFGYAPKKGLRNFQTRWC